MATVIFAGHMVDAPGREGPRFPAAKVPAARQAIRSAVAACDDAATGISGAACGGDLLFCEEWLAAGRPLTVYLPGEPEAFLDESVRVGGEEWEEAFRRVTAHPRTTLVGPEPGTAGDPHLANTMRMLAAGLRDRPLHGWFLWDGEGGDGPGGTADMVAQVREGGGTVSVIDPAVLGRKVVISYRRSSSAEAAEALGDELRRRGLDVFRDVEDIEAGERFPEALFAAFMEATVVVALVDEAYFDSWYCVWEWQMAMLPYRVATRSGDPDNLPWLVVGLSTTNERLPPPARAVNWPAPADAAALADVVVDRARADDATLAGRIGPLAASLRDEILGRSRTPQPRSLAGTVRSPDRFEETIGDRFVGREAALWEIDGELRPLDGGPPGTHVLHGGGGMGKTRLALEYLWRSGHHYRGGVVWLECNADASVVEDRQFLAWRAFEPGLPRDVKAAREAELDIPAGLAAALTRAADAGPVLMVLNDLPEPGDGGRPRPLSSFCPAPDRVSLLATTRLRTYALDAGGHGVGPLETAPAVALLNQRLGEPFDEETAARVVNAVGEHPLAIELLNKAVQLGAVSPGEVAATVTGAEPIAGLEELYADLAPYLPEGSVRGVVETLRLTFDTLDGPSRRAVAVLGALAPSPIPVELYERLVDVDRRTVRAQLTARSLLEPATAEGVATVGRMHPLVASFARLGADDDAASSAADALLELMDPDRIRGMSAAQPVSALVPHAEAVAAPLSPADPRRTRLLWRLDIAASARGDLAGARRWGDLTWRETLETWGERHPDTLTSANNLAATLEGLGDLAAARDLFEVTYRTMVEMLGERHPPATLISANNLAETLRGLGDLAAARDLFEATYRTRVEALGERHPDTLTSANNLAATLEGLGDLAAARDLFEATRRTMVETLGERHPDTLTSTNNLAATLEGLEDLAGARDLHEVTYRTRMETLGEHHPATTVSGWNLLATLVGLGDTDTARSLIDELVWLMDADPRHLTADQARSGRTSSSSSTGAAKNQAAAGTTDRRGDTRMAFRVTSACDGRRCCT